MAWPALNAPFSKGCPSGRFGDRSSLGGQPDLLQPCQLCPSRLQPPSQRGLETQAVSAQLSPPGSGGEGAHPGAAAQAPQAEAASMLWGNSADLLQVQRSRSALFWTASPCSTSHPSTWSQAEAEPLLVIAFFPHPWVNFRVSLVLWRYVPPAPHPRSKAGSPHSGPALTRKQRLDRD